MSDDDRPKKSWRERDRSKDRSRHREDRPKPGERSDQRVQRSSAYQSYKSNLDKLFTPGGASLPPSLQEKLGTVSEDSKAKKALARALHEKSDAASLAAYLDDGQALPDDARLLMRLMDINDEALLKPVLTALLEIVDSGKRPSRMLMIQKLDALELRLGSGPAVDLAKQIRAALD